MLSFLQYSSRFGLYSYLKTGFFHQNLIALIQIREREKQQQQWKLQVTWDRTEEWARVPWTAYQDHPALLVCKTQPEGNGWASWSSDQSWYVFESERKINGFKVTTEIPKSEKVKAKRIQGQDKNTRLHRSKQRRMTSVIINTHLVFTFDQQVQEFLSVDNWLPVVRHQTNQSSVPFVHNLCKSSWTWSHENLTNSVVESLLWLLINF